MRIDPVVLLLRFVLGCLLGGVLFLWLALWWGVPLIISGPLPVVVGILAAVWGDRFLTAVMTLLGKVLS